jgi:hypothetical protein
LVLHDTLIRATRNAKGTAIQNAVVEKPGRPPIYVFFSMLSGKRVTISLHYHPSEKRPSLIARLGPGATLLELKISCGTRCYVDLCMTRDTISADWRSNARFIDAVREIFKGTVLTRMKNVAQGPLVDILASPTEMSKVVSAMLRETYPWSPQRVNLAYPPKPITNTTGIRKVSVFPVPNVTMGQNGHRALNIAITKNRANVLLPRLKSMMHVMQSILLAKPWVDTPGLFNAHHVRHVTANLYVQYVKQFGMFVVHVSDDRHHSAALTSMTVRVTQDGTLAGFAIRHGYERLMIDMDNPARVLVSVSSFPNANAIHRSIMAFVTDVLPGKLRGTARGKLANVLQRPTFWAEVPRNTGAKIISTNKILTSPR